MNSPFAFVTAVEATPVPCCVAVTETPGSTRAAGVDDAADDGAGVDLCEGVGGEGRGRRRQRTG